MLKKIIHLVTIILFGLSTLAFIYALGFFTNLVPTQDPYPEFFIKAQNFNRYLFNSTFLILLGMGINISLTLKNKKLSKTKFIFLSFMGLLIIINSFLMIIKLKDIQLLYLTLDFTNPNFLIHAPSGYVPSRFLFVFGKILSVLMIIFGITIQGALLYLGVKKGGKTDES